MLAFWIVIAAMLGILIHETGHLVSLSQKVAGDYHLESVIWRRFRFQHDGGAENGSTNIRRQ